MKFVISQITSLILLIVRFQYKYNNCKEKIHFLNGEIMYTHCFKLNL